MAKIIFLFQNLKITNTSLEDLQVTEEFLTGKQVDELGYNPEELARAYEVVEKNYKFV